MAAGEIKDTTPVNSLSPVAGVVKVTWLPTLSLETPDSLIWVSMTMFWSSSTVIKAPSGAAPTLAVTEVTMPDIGEVTCAELMSARSFWIALCPSAMPEPAEACAARNARRFELTS